MTTIIPMKKSATELRRRWRTQIARRLLNPRQRPPRRIGALGYLVEGARNGHFVELSRLTIVVVHDHLLDLDRTVVRVSGYRATLGSHQVHWGGAENHRLLKDLTLVPKPFAKGLRIDSRNTGLLQLALRLDHRIQQALHHEQRISRTQLMLPRLWAGYKPSTADQLAGEGEELEALCQKFGLTRAALLAKFRSAQDGLVLLPAAWVASDLHRAMALFAELSSLPARQAFLMDEPSAVLRGSTTGPVAACSTTVQPRVALYGSFEIGSSDFS